MRGGQSVCNVLPFQKPRGCMSSPKGSKCPPSPLNETLGLTMIAVKFHVWVSCLALFIFIGLGVSMYIYIYINIYTVYINIYTSVPQLYYLIDTKSVKKHSKKVCDIN